MLSLFSCEKIQIKNAKKMKRILSIELACLLACMAWGQRPLPGFWEDPYEIAMEIDTACGAEYEWHGKIYTHSGTYIDTILINGYKTPVALNLILSNPQPSKTFVNVREYDFPYHWNGQIYTTPGTYSITRTNEYGCDSVAYLYLHSVGDCEPYMQVIHIDKN